MAINLTNLFTALGHLYYPLKRAHTFAATNLTTDVAAAVAGLGVTNADLGGPLAAGLGNLQSGQSGQLGGLIRTAAKGYLCRIVNADVPLSDPNNVTLALRELVRQMIVQSYKVSACTVTAAATPAGGNTGNGAVVATVKNPFGLQQDNLFAETGVLTCTGDSQNGTGTAGGEPFTYRGDFAPVSDLGFDWPGYSGASASLNAVNAAGGGPNLLSNGNFETFTVTDTPDNWALATGTTASTNIFSEGSTVYAGSKAVKFLGNGSTRPTIQQTLTTLKPNRVYAVNLWSRAGGALTSTSTLSARLVDGSNTVINDDAGNANGFDIALTALTTSYAAYGGVLITPKVLPATVKVQIESSRGANLVSTEAVYIDQLAMTEIGFLYPGGPGLAVFAGAVPFMTNDSFDVTTANNQNGASYGATWQRVFDRLFGMRGLGLLLPTTGTTLLNDSLIA